MHANKFNHIPTESPTLSNHDPVAVSPTTSLPQDYRWDLKTQSHVESCSQRPLHRSSLASSVSCAQSRRSPLTATYEGRRRFSR